MKQHTDFWAFQNLIVIFKKFHHLSIFILKPLFFIKSWKTHEGNERCKKKIHLLLLNEIFQADLTFGFVLLSLPKNWKNPALFCRYESFLKVLIHSQNLKNSLFSSFSQTTNHVCWTLCLPLFPSVSSIFLFPWSGLIINNSDVLAKLVTQNLTSSDGSMYTHQPLY